MTLPQNLGVTGSRRRMRATAEGLADSFELAIVGGGSLGCALAWEAASRGISVILLEQEDFGSGASANSLKIVHGGLRYLQSMDLRRARALAFERSAWLRIAPHLVQPLAFILPTRPGLLRGRLALAGGLALNALVTFDRNRGLAAARRLSAGGLINLKSVATAAPGLNLEGVTGGARWFDAQMIDSERLSLSLALGAKTHGAVLLNHHRVIEYTSQGVRVSGVVAENRLEGTTRKIGATVVADCRCAWGSAGANPPGSANAPPFIKAINLVLPGTNLQCGVGFPVRNARGEVIKRRMLFAAPWKDTTLVGTWYSHDSRGPGSDVSASELATMLDALNASYGGWNFQPSDVRALHVGFLPAIPGYATDDGEPVPLAKSICEPATAVGGLAGVWYLQTEKWTTVRRLSQHFVDRVSQLRLLHASPSRTAWTPLPGEEGDLLLERAANSAGGRETIPGSDGVMAAQIGYAIEYEHARTLNDLMRRTGIGSTGRPGRETLESLALHAAGPLAWDTQEQRRQVDEALGRPQFRFGDSSPNR